MLGASARQEYRSLTRFTAAKGARCWRCTGGRAFETCPPLEIYRKVPTWIWCASARPRMSTSSQSVSNALNTRKHGSLTRFLRWYLLPRMHPFRMRRRGQSGGSQCFGLCRKGARNAAHKLLYFAKSHATISDHFNNSQSRVTPPTNPTSYLELCLEYIFTTCACTDVSKPKKPVW